jgi:hypothetical protein
MVHIFDDACTAAQRVRLAAWVTELRQTNQLGANPYGPHRFHRNIAELGWVHPDLLEIRAALVGRFGLGPYRTDPAFGDMVSFHEPGAFVHEHTDPVVEGERHVRLNVLLQHPEAGGTPILDGEPLAIAPGQGWIFRPYKVKHSSTAVEGSTPRINLSMGWSVSPSFRLPGEATRGHMGLVEELFDAIGRADEPRIRRLLAPDAVVRFPGGGAFGGAHEGIDAVLALWARQRQFLTGKSYVVQTLDILEGHDHVIVLTRVRAGETDAWETVNLYRIVNGQIVEASPLVRGREAFDRFWSQ